MDPSAGPTVSLVIGTVKSTTVTTNLTTTGTIVVNLNHGVDILMATLIPGAWWARKHPANGDLVPTAMQNVHTLTFTAIYHPMQRSRKLHFSRWRMTITSSGPSIPILPIIRGPARILSFKPIAPNLIDSNFLLSLFLFWRRVLFITDCHGDHTLWVSCIFFLTLRGEGLSLSNW